MRPAKFYRYVPQSWDINSNATIWKILNRTIYHNDSQSWLRNKDSRRQLEDKNMTAVQRETLRKLIEDHGMTHLYSEDMFYQAHKVSRGDFL